MCEHSAEVTILRGDGDDFFRTVCLGGHAANHPGLNLPYRSPAMLDGPRKYFRWARPDGLREMLRLLDRIEAELPTVLPRASGDEIASAVSKLAELRSVIGQRLRGE